MTTELNPTSMRLTVEELARLKELAAELGIPVTEVLRRLIARAKVVPALGVVEFEDSPSPR